MPEGSGYSEQAAHAIVTPTAVVFTLGEEHQAAARACLERSGQITFSFTELAVTDLLQVKELEGGDGGVLVD
jgi:hypothetical protein